MTEVTRGGRQRPGLDEDRRLVEALSLFETLANLRPERIASRLAELAESDRELHRLVREMLEADGDARPLAIDAPTFLSPDDRDPRIGRLLGPYRLLEEIGRGGMGVVYLGERVDGAYESRVAIKVVGMPLAGSEVVERFLVERRLVGRLDHPGIARVLDAGSDPAGTPYFVMEHVDGLPLTSYCDGHRLSVRRRIELFREVCGAVAYAHRNLIVHRDLKPANILVDGRGQPKLLDFGIAKLLEDGRASGGITQLGQRRLTPDYASPEQLEGRAVSTASDVYSLGVVLYELLTGRLPTERGSGGTRTSHSAQRPASRVVKSSGAAVDRSFSGRQGATELSKTAASDRGLSNGRALARLLAGDLDVIVAKALNADPERRYGSATELSDDLRRHLEGLPIRAEAERLLYRWRKFLARNRAAVASALLIVLSLVGGLVVSAVSARRAISERQRAERASIKAERINRFLMSVVQTADPSWYVDAEVKGPDTRIIDVLDEASARIGSELADAPVEKADLLTTLGNTLRALGMYERAEKHLWQALELRLRHQGEVHADTVETLYFLAAAMTDRSRAIEVQERAVAAELALDRPSSNGAYLLADSANTRLALGQLDEAGRRLAAARTRLGDDMWRLANQIERTELELEIHRGELARALAVEPGAEDRRARPKVIALLLLDRGTEALRVLDRASPGIAGRMTATVAIRAATSAGHFDRARELLERELALPAPALYGELELMVAEADLQRATGGFATCADQAARIRAGWLELTDSLSPLIAADLDWIEGACHLGAGRPDAALPLLLSASAGFADLYAGRSIYGGRVEAAVAEARSRGAVGFEGEPQAADSDRPRR